ncbi:hypothetical protein LPJ56_004911 [Coemansia sp. RSA 2599]|nr:hypothetical protein LPJ75_004793 [Coemansia sp. RSA 2598]KAJ1814236.1 hypothetical protein LPJ56_004911 [Coemansia sp. RSA 2599]
MVFGCAGFVQSLRSLREPAALKQALHQLRFRHNSAIRMDAAQKRKVLGQFQNQADVLVYDRQAKPTLYRWGPWVAGGQMLMWLNFADFYWRYSMDKNEETGELVLSPAWKRACISAVAIVAGVSIGGGLLHYISRSVATMRILNSGQTVRLETYRITGRGTRAREFPTAKMYSRDTLYTGQGPQGVTRQGSPQYSINARGSSYAFIMNRAGWFKSPKNFDIVFHRSVVPAP